MPIIRIQSTSESVPPKSFEYFKISCFALTLFFVVTTAPCLRPICLPFLRAVSIPSFVRWCKSETSFSDCSKAFFGFYKRKSKCLILFSFRSTIQKNYQQKKKKFACRRFLPFHCFFTHWNYLLKNAPTDYRNSKKSASNRRFLLPKLYTDSRIYFYFFPCWYRNGYLILTTRFRGLPPNKNQASPDFLLDNRQWAVYT